MNCPNCQAEVQAGQRFCPDCGTRLDAGCRACSAPLPSGARFCPACGTPTDHAAAAADGPTTATPIAERRVVSILFADLVGFTTRAAVEAVDAAPRKGRAVEAKRLALRAGATAMEGDQRGALESFGEAFRTLRDLGLLFDLACHQIDMAALFAGTPQGEAVAAEARAAFESMGAMGLAAQVDAVTAGALPGTSHQAASRPQSAPTEVV